MSEIFVARLRKSGLRSSTVTVLAIIKEKMKLKDGSIVKVTVDKE
jgi:hypothetical protein